MSTQLYCLERKQPQNRESMLRCSFFCVESSGEAISLIARVGDEEGSNDDALASTTPAAVDTLQQCSIKERLPPVPGGDGALTSMTPAVVEEPVWESNSGSGSLSAAVVALLCPFQRWSFARRATLFCTLNLDLDTALAVMAALDTVFDVANGAILRLCCLPVSMCSTLRCLSICISTGALSCLLLSMCTSARRCLSDSISTGALRCLVVSPCTSVLRCLSITITAWQNVALC